jgi:phage gpG-like protein
MAELRFVVNPQFKGGQTKLGMLMSAVKNMSPAAKAAATQLTAETIRHFDEGGNPMGRWNPLSKFTIFCRRHRASAPDKSGDIKPLVDTGRLKGSFVPIGSDDGTQLGVGTNVDYAELMQKGGMSQGGPVEIGEYWRRAPVTTMASLSRVLRKGVARAGRVTVHAYTMNVGSHAVPPRPFFPDGIGEADEWGYVDKIRQIYAMFFKQAWGES